MEESTVSVRVSRCTYDKLKEMNQEIGTPMSKLIAKAVNLWYSTTFEAMREVATDLNPEHTQAHNRAFAAIGAVVRRAKLDNVHLTAIPVEET